MNGGGANKMVGPVRVLSCVSISKGRGVTYTLIVFRSLGGPHAVLSVIVFPPSRSTFWNDLARASLLLNYES